MNLTGLTTEEKGTNLPKNLCQGGNWTYRKTINIKYNDSAIIGAPTVNEILTAIKKEGYYINYTSLKFDENDNSKK